MKTRAYTHVFEVVREKLKKSHHTTTRQQHRQQRAAAMLADCSQDQLLP